MSKPKTVLVVDDDPGMLRGLERLLKQHGYDSILFSGADAFNKHDNFEQAICVVLDINLGNSSGLDLHRQLEAAGIFLPVIFITGNDNRATRAAAIESGCVAYLTKPFAAQSLLGPLERLSAGLA